MKQKIPLLEDIKKYTPTEISQLPTDTKIYTLIKYEDNSVLAGIITGYVDYVH